MSYIGGTFEHDIFVSYSHGDVDGSGSSLLKQWSHGLVHQLEKELKAFPDIGPHINVFLDQHHRPDQGLDPNSHLTEALKSKISTSGILTVIMCPHYLGSDWCRREREWWFATTKSHGFDPVNRLAVARVWPAEDKDWPIELCDAEGVSLVGNYFFNKELAADYPQPYGWPKVDDTTVGEFRNALLDLVTTLRRTLIRTKTRISERKKQDELKARLSAENGQLIYLHARQEHEAEWSRAVARLSDAGFSVFPLAPEHSGMDIKTAEKVRIDRVKTMTGCDAILILGVDHSSSLSSDIATIGRLDRQQAIARSLRPLPCGVLDTLGLARTRPTWPKQIGQLGIDWLDVTDKNPAILIRNWLSGVSA
jgi:hypothetical protein